MVSSFSGSQDDIFTAGDREHPTLRYEERFPRV